MVFCIHCGRALSPDAEKLRGAGMRSCTNCGQIDELSGRFCIHCASELPPPAGTQSSQTNPSISDISRLRTTPPSSETDLVPSRPKKKAKALPWTAIAAVAGLSIGVAAALLAVNMRVGELFTQYSWPKKGLIIYADPPHVQITVEDKEHRNFTLGETGDDGSLVFYGLPPGEYTIKFSGDSNRTVVHPPVRLEDNKATVIGFPKRIQLPPRHS